MVNIIKGLLPSGKAPSVLKQEIIELVKSEAPAPDLSKYATKEELQSITPNMLEGEVKIFASLAQAKAWEAENPGKVALTSEPQTPDTTPPTSPGNLTVTPSMTSALLTVTGAQDDRPIAGYRFKVGEGPYSPWQISRTFTATGLNPDTEYAFLHEIKDAGDYTLTGSPVTARTTKRPAVNWAEYKNAIQGAKPLLYFPLEEGPDNLGSLTITEVSGTDVTYQAGGASFNGASSVVSFRLPQRLPLGAFTLEGLWVNNKSTSSAFSLLSFGGNTQIMQALGKITGKATPDFKGIEASVDATPAMFGQLHHLALAYDGASVALYIDGVQVASTEGSGTVYFDGQAQIGGMRSHPVYAAKGSIGHVALFDRALPASEIKQRAIKAGVA